MLVIIIAGIFLVGGLVLTSIATADAHSIKKAGYSLTDENSTSTIIYKISRTAAITGAVITAISFGTIVHILSKK